MKTRARNLRERKLAESNNDFHLARVAHRANELDSALVFLLMKLDSKKDVLMMVVFGRVILWCETRSRAREFGKGL